jgi:hypothetical protein
MCYGSCIAKQTFNATVAASNFQLPPLPQIAECVIVMIDTRTADLASQNLVPWQCMHALAGPCYSSGNVCCTGSAKLQRQGLVPGADSQTKLTWEHAS